MHLKLEDFESASKRISGLVARTPMIQSDTLTSLCGSQVFLKDETTQEIGAFKVRGAANKIVGLSAEEKKYGVVTLSTGNHGRAVAFIAKKLGIDAVVCLSENVPQNKVQAIKDLGAQVIRYGKSQDEAGIKAQELVEKEKRTLIHPFDDLAIIAGQGTIALEILEQNPEIQNILIPLSGGGLMAGISLCAKLIKPSVKIWGISMESGPAMYHSLKAGQPIDVEETETVADSLKGGIGLQNKYTFDIVKNYMDHGVLLTEEEIKKAMRFLHKEHNLQTEGAAAVGVGALLSKKIVSTGPTAVVISGKNIDENEFLKIIQQGEAS